MSFLVRARLKSDASIASIATLLLPQDAARRAEASHRLLWSLFAGDPSARREFLWREESAGTFYILSARAPDENAIFDVEVKEFAPALAVGDRLRFSLRANATRAYKRPGARRSQRADVVMAALASLPTHERSSQRQAMIQEAGAAWLAGQGTKHGFELCAAPRVDGYNQWKIPRGNAAKIAIATLDFDGILHITDASVFTAALTKGFGHAKAFGCGLMLIRRG